jgi:hypothetical protein
VKAHSTRKMCGNSAGSPIPSRMNLRMLFILFSKTGTFSPEEIALANTLNTEHRRRVILWSRDELEPYYPYERSKDKLGDRWQTSTLTDLANSTHALFFK